MGERELELGIGNSYFVRQVYFEAKNRCDMGVPAFLMIVSQKIIQEGG